MSPIRTRLLAATLAALFAAPMVHADDAGDVRHLMMATFDKPEAR